MTDKLTFADRMAMLLGGGLIVLGTIVLGFFEAILGTPNTMPVTNDAGEVTAATTFDPQLRAYIIAAGLIVWLVYVVYKVAQPTPPETSDPTPSGAD